MSLYLYQPTSLSWLVSLFNICYALVDYHMGHGSIVFSSGLSFCACGTQMEAFTNWLAVDFLLEPCRANRRCVTYLLPVVIYWIKKGWIQWVPFSVDIAGWAARRTSGLKTEGRLYKISDLCLLNIYCLLHTVMIYMYISCRLLCNILSTQEMQWYKW